MTDILTVLQEWTNLSIVGGALVLGYILKNYIDMNSKHIPLIMAITGIAISFVLNGYVGFEKTIIAGALSGLTSTGLHQVFKQYLSGIKEDVTPEYFDVYKDKEDN